MELREIVKDCSDLVGVGQTWGQDTIRGGGKYPPCLPLSVVRQRLQSLHLEVDGEKLKRSLLSEQAPICLDCLMQAVFYHVSCAENIESCGQTKKYCFCNKNVLEFVWKHFCFSGSKNFVSPTMFPQVGKAEKRHRKRNVSATMFPSLRGP